MDIDLIGTKYTWSNKRLGEDIIQFNMDRALISYYLIVNYYCSITSFSKIGSNEIPIIFSTNTIFGEKKFPFIFEKMWIVYSNFENFFKSFFDIKVDGFSMFSMVKKIYNVKKCLKFGARQVLQTIFLLRMIFKVSYKISKTIFMCKDVLIKFMIWKTIFLLRIVILFPRKRYFKGKSIWLAKGDKDTKYFHISTLKHRDPNQISHINTKRGGITNEEEITMGMMNHFSSILSVQKFMNMHDQEKLLITFPNLFFYIQKKNLVGIPSSSKIKYIVISFNRNKAPRLDGFTMCNSQEMWNIIYQDESNVVKDFFGARILLREINSNIFVLSPKQLGIDSIDQFRPISLCNTLYKIISKVLASVILNIIPNLIFMQQNDFFLGGIYWILINSSA